MPKSEKDAGQDLTYEAYSNIRRMIFSNVLKPDQKILYRQIAKSLDMSLTPVVQALKHLEFMGLVYHRPNRGYCTTRVTRQEVQEGFELRNIVECFLIPKIISGLNKSKQAKLKKALDEYCDLNEDTNKMILLVKDINFHMTLAEISQHERSIWILRYLFDVIYLRIGQSTHTIRPQSLSKEEHIAVYDAIVKKDQQAALSALQDHINAGQDHSLKAFDQNDSELLDIVF